MLKRLLARPEVTETCELRGRFGIMAFHGGNLERTTDAVASEVATRTGSSLYTVCQSAPLREHLPSTAFDPADSTALASFLEHVEIVIAVHGYGRPSLRNQLLVGGRNRDLASHVATHLRGSLRERYGVIDDTHEIPRELRGLHERNPVNRPQQTGVQLELPPSIRWNHRENGWSDHHGVSRTRDVDDLIGGLSRAVAGWEGF